MLVVEATAIVVTFLFSIGMIGKGLKAVLRNRGRDV